MVYHETNAQCRLSLSAVLWCALNFHLPEREKTLRGLNFFLKKKTNKQRKTTQNLYVFPARQPRSRAQNLWALETVLQQSVSPSDLISLLQLLIRHAPVEPGRLFSRTESSQRCFHLGFELCRANIDWLCCVALTTQFLSAMSLSPSHTLCPISLSLLYIHAVFLLSDPSLYFVFPLSPHPRLSLTSSSFFYFLPVALYAISAVYFAGVMVRLMLTLTPVVCMLSAVAFSSVFEHYMGDDTKREKPPAEDSSDEDDKRNSGNLYDKVNRDRIIVKHSHDHL